MLAVLALTAATLRGSWLVDEEISKDKDRAESYRLSRFLSLYPPPPTCDFYNFQKIPRIIIHLNFWRLLLNIPRRDLPFFKEVKTVS